MLDSDATLRDLWKNGLLNDAEEYLRKIFVRYRELSADLGECTITIGLTGTGQSPNYRVKPISTKPAIVSREALFTGKTSSENERIALKQLSNAHACYSGLNHKRLDLAAGNEHWSSKPMSFAEFQTLRSDVRESNRKTLMSGKKGGK